MQVTAALREWAVRPVLSDVYGTARTLLALSTAATLIFNDVTELFPAGMVISTTEGAAYPWSIFVLLEPPQLARFVALALLLLVASGWRPRVTGVVHAWVSLSLAHTPAILDGGEHVAQTFSLLLLPLTLLDGRKWHWDPARAHAVLGAPAHVFWFGLRFQACVIYLEAASSKLAVEEWRNGTALYYWVSDPTLGSGPTVRALLSPLLNNPFTLTMMTWGVIAFEFTLAAALIASAPVRRVLLPLGIAFHLAIIFLHGITSFAVAMCAVLLLYLRDPAAPFAWRLRSFKRKIAHDPLDQPPAHQLPARLPYDGPPC